MATVVNFIDVTLRGAAARTVNLASAQILLTPSAPAFHVDVDGVVTPETITFTATLIDLDTPLTFNATGAPLTNPTAKSVTIAGASMTGSSVTVIASATVNGQLYTGPCTISKFKDGKDGVDGDGANLTAGDLKAILEGQITTDQLTAALNSRIGLIDGGADVAGSVTARVKAETDARIAAISQASTDNRTYVQQYTYSQQTINDSFSAFGTNIQAAYQGYANGAADGALASAKSFAQSYSYSKADADSSLTATANQLRSEFATLNQGAGATVAWVQEYAYSKAQANDAIASATQQLSTTVGGHTATLEIQSQSISGLGAQITTKIDNNGYVSGYGLASTPINGVPTSSFIVLADRFAVALPGQAPKFPFVIGTVNGQTVIGLRGDVVLDGTLSIRTSAGAPVVDASGLKEGFEAPGTKNSAVSLGDDGSLRGAGGGKVTLHGIGQDVLRVVAAGNPAMASGTPPAAPGVYLNGVKISSPGRSYNLVVIRRSDMAIVKNEQYDVYGSGQLNGLRAADLANWLNNYAAGQFIIILSTYDEPAQNRMDSGLPEAIYRHGGSRAVFGSPRFQPWSAYVLIAISGCGEGNGAEGYQGSVSADPNAWVDMSFTLNNGSLVVGNNYTPRSLADYSYFGDLDATKGAPAGTLVGGSLAQNVETWAVQGSNAYGLIPAINNEIGKRLNSEASNILRAPITITTGGGVVVGSLMYNATNGLYGSGSGVAITPYGIIGHDGNKYTFGISGATGAAFFGGELQAAYGTFGALRIAPGGYVAQGAFDGSWAWPASGGGFLVHANGLLFGNRNDPASGFFSIGSNGVIEAPGLSYTNRQLRLDSPVIINPVLSPFNISVTNSQNQYNYTLWRGSTDAYAGLYSVSISTGADGAAINWTVSGPWPCWLVQDSNSTRMQLHINMKGGAPLAGDSGDFYINCSVTKGGNTVNTQQLVNVTAS
jgi:hypothetical protein